MSATLTDRLKRFQIPPAVAIPADAFGVARLRGIDFEGIFNSPDFEYENAFDARFGKMMVRTASHLLGGDACGRYAYCELTEFSVMLDRSSVAGKWNDAAALQNYLAALASTKMTLLVEDEALFSCQLFGFPTADLAVAYLTWRQQDAYLTALDGYCRHVLAKDENTSNERVDVLLEGLGPQEKIEILHQNEIDYAAVPAWQRYGTGVHLDGVGGKVSVETTLPREGAYAEYVQRMLET